MGGFFKEKRMEDREKRYPTPKENKWKKAHYANKFACKINMYRGQDAETEYKRRSKK